MDIARGMLLSMLRNVFFKLFLFSPTLWYLINKLHLDVVSAYVRGFSAEDLLLETGKKLREEWRLLIFGRIRFYRKLAQEGLITQNQLRRLENNAKLAGDPLDDTFLIEVQIGPEAAKERMLVAIIEHKPVPLPWNIDRDFFEKHQNHKKVLGELRKQERLYIWHSELWLALVEGV